MLKIRYSNQFKRDYKLIKKRGYDINKLKDVVNLISEGQKLPIKYKEHNLTGIYKRIYRMPYSTRLAFNI